MKGAKAYKNMLGSTPMTLDLQILLDLFVAITEGIRMVLENDAFAQIERIASLFYSLKVGDDVCYRSLNG
jgi:hypothetical protein